MHLGIFRTHQPVPVHDVRRIGGDGYALRSGLVGVKFQGRAVAKSLSDVVRVVRSAQRAKVHEMPPVQCLGRIDERHSSVAVHVGGVGAVPRPVGPLLHEVRAANLHNVHRVQSRRVEVYKRLPRMDRVDLDRRSTH